MELPKKTATKKVIKPVTQNKPKKIEESKPPISQLFQKPSNQNNVQIEQIEEPL